MAAGAVLTGQLPWYALAALALVPVLVRLPLPGGAPWMQGIAAALYAAAAAVGAWVLAWLASRGCGRLSFSCSRHIVNTSLEKKA